MVASESNVSTKTLDDEFDRKKNYINTCNFDDGTLRRRDIEMKELCKAYPNMPESWLELCWNFCTFTSQEEQDNIIKNKLWEGKPTNRRQTGGTIKDAMSIMTREEFETSGNKPEIV
tara:strand:- start:5800 stop:6150 length:351 start_codon:yes stop_codon:yes gene_type:complete